MMTDRAEAKKQTDQFEQLNTQLLAILESLESEGTTLEQALSQFEEGMTLIRSLQKALSEAEQRVVEIIGDLIRLPNSGIFYAILLLIQMVKCDKVERIMAYFYRACGSK